MLQGVRDHGLESHSGLELFCIDLCCFVIVDASRLADTPTWGTSDFRADSLYFIINSEEKLTKLSKLWKQAYTTTLLQPELILHS
jgi:hypothetical protein